MLLIIQQAEAPGAEEEPAPIEQVINSNDKFTNMASGFRLEHYLRDGTQNVDSYFRRLISTKHVRV